MQNKDLYTHIVVHLDMDSHTHLGWLPANPHGLALVVAGFTFHR